MTDVAIRDEQVALTRQRIIDTFLELAGRAGARPVTMAQVARSSGISPATVYRHFPNRQELLVAAANRDAMLGLEDLDGHAALDDLRTHFVALWRRLSANIALARESAVSEAGLELRRARAEPLLGVLRQSLTDAGVDVDTDDGRHLVHALAVLMSVHAFLDLHDRHGLSAEEAGDTVTWAMKELLRARGIDPDRLVFVDPIQLSPALPSTDPNGDRP